MNLFSRRYIPLFIGLVILSLDFLTKYLTDTYLPVMNGIWPWYPYGGIPVFKNFLGIEFSISHQTNQGAAWGILKHYQLPLLYFRIFLISMLLCYTMFFNRHKNWTIPLSLIIAGAIGNVIDYFIYGHVVDMFHFILWGYNFPVFNVADSSIFLGVASLLLLSAFERSPKKESV